MLWKNGARPSSRLALAAPGYGIRGLDEVGDKRAVGELDELGQAGGAAGGQQQRDLTRVGPLGGRLAAAGQQLAELEHLESPASSAARAVSASGPTVTTNARPRASQLVGELAAPCRAGWRR